MAKNPIQPPHNGSLMYRYVVPAAILLITAFLVVVQFQVINNSNRFNRGLCAQQNASKDQVNRQGKALRDFLKASQQISKQAEKLQPPQANPPALKKIREEYRIELEKLKKGLGPLAPTDCNG